MSNYTSLVVTGPNEHGFQETARLPLPADHVRVEVAAVALCGTDFKLLRGELHDARYPVIPGHEWSGYVSEAPGEPDLPGKLVVASIYSPCGKCEWCRAGLCQHCIALAECGFTLPGACADEVVVPRGNIRVVPEHLGAAASCLIEPLTVAVHAIDRAPRLDGQKVVVLGGGAVGLLLLQLVIAAGGECTVVEPLAERRDLAEELGAAACVADACELAECSAQVLFDATGESSAFSEGLKLLRPTGTYVLVGYSSDFRVEFAPSRLMLKEISVHGVLSGFGTLDRAIDAAASGAVDLDRLIAAPMHLRDYKSLLDRSLNLPPRQPLTLRGVSDAR